MDASHQISRCLDHSVWLDVGNKQHLSVREKQGDQQAQLKWGTLLPTFFWIAQLGSFAFPGAKGLEAEFPHLVPKIGPVRLNEAPFSLTMLSVLGLGYVLEKRASV